MGKQLATIQRENEILSILNGKALTLAEITDLMALPYYSVRRTVSSLHEEGRIKIVDTQDKHHVYSINSDYEGLGDTIPRLIQLLNKRSTKAIFLLESTGKEDQLKSTIAAKSLTKHIAVLMHEAQLAHHGQDVVFSLEQERKAMQDNLLYLKNITSLFEQILKEPRFWNPQFLQQMADDPDFNYVAVQQAYDYYKEK